MVRIGEHNHCPFGSSLISVPLNFPALLNGYEQFCRSNKEVSVPHFDVPSQHVPYALSSGRLLNGRIYQRWVYLEVRGLIPECMILAKETLPLEKYHKIARRVYDFVSEMKKIGDEWRTEWSRIRNFLLEAEACAQRRKVLHLEEILAAIHISDLRNEAKPIAESVHLKNREEAWLQMVTFINEKWIPNLAPKLTVQMPNDVCVKSEFKTEYHRM